MKKQFLPLLLGITMLFCAFTLGFFLGRNQNHDVVSISVLPDHSRHTLPNEERLETTAAEISVTFPIDLNSAQLHELTALPGIGETLARRILQYRQHNGPFGTPADLMNVDGIGSGKLEAILDYVTTGG